MLTWPALQLEINHLIFLSFIFFFFIWNTNNPWLSLRPIRKIRDHVFSNSLYSILLVLLILVCSKYVDACIYVCIHVWIDGFIDTSALALCAQFDSAVLSHNGNTSLGCTIPALIWLPTNCHPLPLPPECICHGSHTWHSWHRTSQVCGWYGLLFCFSVFHFAISVSSYILKRTNQVFVFLYFIFLRSPRIFFFFVENICATLPYEI